MKTIFGVIVLISLNNCILCVDFEDCGSADGKISSVTVSGCSSSDTTCILKSGSTGSIDVKFTSNVDSSSNTIKLWGIIGGAPVPFPANPSDGCKSGLTCPVTKGSSQELQISMPVSASYPKIEFKVRVAVVDSNGSNLFCTQFPAKIE